MKRKIAIAMLSAAIACCSAVGLAACVTDSGDTSEPFWTIETAYAEAQDLGYGGTLEEFLAQIQGEDGKDGQDGQDGIGIADIFVDENGMLYVTLSDGGQIECGNVRGEQGAPGVGITGAEIDIDGNLILYLSTGEPINCGKVVGSNGQDGLGILNAYVDETGQLTIEYTDGSITNVGAVVGEPGQDGQNGQDGQDGVGIQDINIVNDRLVITLTNNTRLNLGNIKGDNGEDGKDGDSISGAFINENGELVLNFTSGNNINVGNVVGSDGTDISNITIDENNNLIIYLSNGGYFNLGNIKGQDGADGADGVGIQNIAINEFGELVITLTNNNVLNLGNVMGANGQDGADGVGIHHIDIVNGNLIVTLTNDVEFDLGNIMGTDGTNGEDGDSVSSAYINENGELVLTFVSGKQITVGNVVGADGQNGADGVDGKDGVGVQNVVINENGELVITLTNQTELNLGNVTGADGNDGKDGASVTAAHIDSNGHLILTFNNEHTLDCGNVMGTDGVGIRDIAFNESGELIITMTDDSIINCGKIPVCVHQYSDWNTVLLPTCTSIGYETRTCLICGDVAFNFKEKYGHIALAYSYDQFCHYYFCERCGLYITEKHIYNYDSNNICSLCQYEADYSTGLQFTLNEDKSSYSVSGIGFCSDTNIVIPEKYNNLPVTKIGYAAFSDCTTLRSITIPESITSIGENAFYFCSNLTQITIPSSIEHIGNYAFYNCFKLVEVYNLSSLEFTIGDTANGFVAYYALNVYTNSEEESNQLTTSDGYIFYEDGNTVYLTGYIGNAVNELILPNNFNGKPYSINKYAFSYYNYNSIKTIVVGNEVDNIGEHAFSHCRLLTNIYLPNNIKYIGYDVFFGCSNLQYNEYDNAIYLGNSDNPYLVLIKAKSTLIPSCQINNDTKIIYHNAFADCASLIEIIIPDNMIYINDGAFKSCTNLKSITIGDSIKDLGRFSFAHLPNLSQVYFNARECNDLNNSGSDVFNGSGGNYGINLIIGKEVTRIPANLFNWQASSSPWNSFLKTIKFEQESKCKSIGKRAFYNCSALLSVTIPESIMDIEENAFSNCFKLVEIYNFSTLDIVKGVDNYGGIGFYALDIYTSINEQSKLSATENGYIFYDDGETPSLICHIGSETNLSLPSNYNGSNYTIGKYAFCEAGYSYFLDYRVNSITSIKIPDSVIHIGERAFSNCSLLSNVKLEATLTTIEAHTFYGCSSLTSITIPDSVTSIGDYAFYDCSNLTSITIPDGVTSIGSSAFENCSSLTSITISDGVKSIDTWAFDGCNSLESVYYTGTAENWAEINIGSDNSNLTNATIYYYSEVEPVEEGNYWHYVDGVVTIW